MSTATLMLKSLPVDPNDFVDSLHGLIQQWGDRSDDLRFTPDGEIDTSPGLRWFQWTHVEDRTLAIQLALDDIRRARYIRVAAPDTETRRLMTLALECHLPTFTVEELREAVCLDGVDDPAAYVRLAMALGGHDTETSRLLQAGLEDPSVAVRAHVAAAIAHLRWPEFGDGVLRARERETDPGVRDLLDRASRWYW